MLPFSDPPTTLQHLPPTRAYMEFLANIRCGDAASGRTWISAASLTRSQAGALGHVDRTSTALQNVLTLLQASESCRRREPEDFGIGGDLHEGLLYAARELAHGMQTHLSKLETSWLRSVGEAKSG